MHYVDLLQSAGDHRRHSIGFTRNLRVRLASHNAGQNPSTVQGRPWHRVCCFAFADETKARNSESYLKSVSGQTFTSRHFP